MADVFSEEKRSWLMAQIRGKDTKPEPLLRSLLHRLGYRFTINGPRNKNLPGKPDIVLPKWHTAICIRRTHQSPTRHSELIQLGWNVIAITRSEITNPEKALHLTNRLPSLIEQKPIDPQNPNNTCHMHIAAEQEGWFE